jgi:hypothetical protein
LVQIEVPIGTRSPTFQPYSFASGSLTSAPVRVFCIAFKYSGLILISL